MTDILRSLSFPAPADLLNMNDRLHHMKRYRIEQAWQDRVGWACVQERLLRAADIPDALPPCIVDIALPVKGKRRRDNHNFSPCIKPCIDALVSVGHWWPDDNSEWVTTLEPTCVVGGTLVTITARART